jgi:LPLT family lysophospholipid transporter-like MFS transporter
LHIKATHAVAFSIHQTLPQNYETMTSTSRGLGAVLTAQFLSALADNALLFAAIALLKATGAPAWHTPLLQEFFLLAYIVLAPFVGHLADAFPKGRVMLVSNGLKLAGAGAMLLGAHPLLAYALVGVGAAAYSPAKYGILSELVTPDKLVKANGLLEGSTIAAILLGVVLGGYLADQGALLAVGVTVAVYVLAALANLRIPALAPSVSKLRAPGVLVREFGAAVRTLMKNPDGRFSLLGTSIFWGTGSTLRFLLVAWVPVALGLMDTSTPANLSGAVAVGIAVGAAAAARFVKLDNVNRALPAGLALGVLIVAFANVTSLPVAIALLVVIGACGGFYVVPLNALLQERGQETVGAGSAIAVQNFFENLVMLVMVGAYTAMAHAGMPPVGMAMTFGAVVLAGIGAVALGRVSKR